MKKLFIIFVLILSTAVCSFAGDLKRSIRDLNRECPIQLIYGIEMTKITSDKGSVTFTCVLDEEDYSLEYFRQNKELLEEALEEIISWMGSDSDFSPMLEDMRADKMELKFSLKGARSNKTHSVTFTTKQYQKLI